jgi:hypothetical protein
MHWLPDTCRARVASAKFECYAVEHVCTRHVAFVIQSLLVSDYIPANIAVVAKSDPIAQ